MWVVWLLTCLPATTGLHSREPLRVARPLATLTPDAAQRLAHKRTLWQVRLDSPSTMVEGWQVVEVEGPSGEHATLWSPPGWIDQASDRHFVEAVLTPIRHGPALVDGQQLPGFVEYRLVMQR